MSLTSPAQLFKYKTLLACALVSLCPEVHPCTCLPPNADPFFFDGEDLRELVDEALLTAGLALFKGHQVTEYDQESDLLWGQAVCAHQVAALLVYGDRMGESGQLLSAADTAIRDRKKQARMAANAATLLLDQGLADGAPDLLVAAIFCACADRAGLDGPLNPQEAGVWLYGQAGPQGHLSADEAGLVMRAMGLAQCTTVPPQLLGSLAEEVALFVGQGS